ncbi:LutC/YkgG family protein [Helicobacter sp. 23-1048]
MSNASLNGQGGQNGTNGGAQNLNAQALNAKEEILARIKEAIASNTHIPHIAEGEPKFPQPLHLSGSTKEALLSDFKENHTNNKSLIIESSKADLPTTIATIIAENDGEISPNEASIKEILCNCDLDCETNALSSALNSAGLESYALLPYAQSVDCMRDRLFGISVSVVQARCGIADLGVIALSSNENAPRLSSLITNICIYLLPKESIVPNMLSGVEFVKGYERKRSGTEILPSNIIFVAGPSRTADIELQTVFGVHGPRKTYTILY